MTVAVVGAGLAGLAAARMLRNAGVEVVVFEKSRALGGRCATRRVGDFSFDSGATSICPDDDELSVAMLEELDRTSLVQIPKPIYVHSGLHPSPGDSKRARPRYAYRGGLNTLPKLVAEGIDVRFETSVELLKEVGNQFQLEGEAGALGLYDRVVLTSPVPQTAQLLWTCGESRPFANVRYRPCISVLLGYRVAPPPVRYFALLDPTQRHPLTWLSLEHEKGADTVPSGASGFVAQMSPAYSYDAYTRPEDSIIADVTGYLARLYGEEFRTPTVTSIKKWKYSQPETVARFESVNPPGSKLIVAGDGVTGPRLEKAYRSGVQAARMILEER